MTKLRTRITEVKEWVAIEDKFGHMKWKPTDGLVRKAIIG